MGELSDSGQGFMGLQTQRQHKLLFDYQPTIVSIGFYCQVRRLSLCLKEHYQGLTYGLSY